MLQFQMKPASSSDNDDESDEDQSSSSEAGDDDDDEDYDDNGNGNDFEADLTEDVTYSQDAQHSPMYEDDQSQSLIQPKSLPVSKALPPLPSMEGLFAKPSTSAQGQKVDSTPKGKKGRKGNVKKSKEKKKKTNSPEMELFAEVGTI
jgi:hypothetical protein